MADTPSSILLLRLQSTGSNTNLWGGYINIALQTLEQASKGYQTQALTGDTTISWTNYATGNKGQTALLKFTGSLAATATVTMPTYMNFVLIWNAAGQTVTVNCSGGTGVAIPNNRKVLVFCDGVDYYFAGPNYLGDDITEANNRDIADRAYVDAAIAAAGTLTPATVRVTGADTTAAYLGSKITVGFSSTTTTQLSGLLSVSQSVESAGGNEKVKLTFGNLEVAGYLDGGRKDAPFTVAAGYAYNVVSGMTFCLPASPSQSAKARVALFNPDASYGINPNGQKINNSTAELTGLTGGQTIEITYDTTLGDWE